MAFNQFEFDTASLYELIENQARYCPLSVQSNTKHSNTKLRTRVLCVLVLDETRGDPHLQAFLTVGLGFHVFGQIPCK